MSVPIPGLGMGMGMGDDEGKTDDVESAATALEAMAAGGIGRRGVVYRRSSVEDNRYGNGSGNGGGFGHGSHVGSMAVKHNQFRRTECWPSIMDYSGTNRNRSAKCVRDMQDVITAVPREDVTMCLVDRFFGDSAICELGLGVVRSELNEIRALRSSESVSQGARAVVPCAPIWESAAH